MSVQQTNTDATKSLQQVIDDANYVDNLKKDIVQLLQLLTESVASDSSINTKTTEMYLITGAYNQKPYKEYGVQLNHHAMKRFTELLLEKTKELSNLKIRTRTFEAQATLQELGNFLNTKNSG